MENLSSDSSTAALLNFPDNAMNASKIPDVALTSWSASEEPGAPARLAVAFWDSPLSHGMNVIVGFILCFTMLGLGCTVEISQMGEHVRRPVGVLLAAICQFAIMPLVAFLLALAFSLDDVAAVAVLLCGCCPGGNLSNLMTLLINGEMNLSVIMTISSTVLALLLMPLCLWLYSRAWIDTPVVQLLPLGAVTLTVCSTLIPIGLGVALRSRYPRAADIVLKVSLWLMLVTLVLLFIMTGVMLGPELLATIPPAVYVVAVLMPMAGYAAGYGLAMFFSLPPNSCRTVSLETGCQNVQLCTAILKLAFPPQLMGAMYMFPLLYALFQAAEAAVIILAYRVYRSEVLRKQDLNEEDDDDTNITYKRMKEEDDGPFDTAYGSVTVNNPNSIELQTQGEAGIPTRRSCVTRQLRLLLVQSLLVPMPEAQELAAEELPERERVRQRRGLLRQLPPRAAPIHPVPDQPEPHTAHAQSQHQGRGRAGQPESRRLGAVLARTAHSGRTPAGRSAHAQTGWPDSRQPREPWGSVPAHAGRVLPYRHAGTRGSPPGP